MDYLNYSKQDQKKPLTKDDFSFGDLLSNVPEQKKIIDAPQSVDSLVLGKDECISVFPTPILVCKCRIDYSREKKWCLDHECDKPNNGQHKQHYNRQSVDTFILDNPELKFIRAFIEEKIDDFASQVLSSTDKLVITQSWLNKNNSGEYHHLHSHPNSIISGVWYPSIDRSLPPIQFHNDRKHQVTMSVRDGGFNNFNSQHFSIPMDEGELVIFPSYLSHCVPPNLSKTERVSLSFNTWIKGSLGDKDSLTYLPLDRCV